MTAKKTPIPVNEDNQKIWGWYSDDDNVMNEDMTRSQAEKAALDYKSKWPSETIIVFKKVATVEVKPYIKGV